jgi:hypothetical protein
MESMRFSYRCENSFVFQRSRNGPSVVREWLGKELVMPKKRFGAEQIVTLLRQIEVSMAQGKFAPEACQDGETSQQN